MPHDRNYDLKFLFVAIFKDGSKHEQTQEDISAINPEEKKTAFYDVKQRLEEVAAFVLTDGENVYSVHMDDGHFEINGLPFIIHEPQELFNPRLIYFRRHRHEILRQTGKEVKHNITYRMGWQANTKEGKNIQAVIEIG